MWLSEQVMRRRAEPDPATLGTVSIGGEDGAVVTDGEKRAVKVISPGGYCWQPDAADEVLVVKGNELYVPGKLQKSPHALAPGEVLIYAGGSEILLTRSGVEITGKLQIAGNVQITGDVHIAGDLYVNGMKMEVP